MSYSNLISKVKSPVIYQGKLVIYNNLPSGGARQTLRSLNDYIRNLKPLTINGTSKKPKNILHYMKIAIIDNFFEDLRLSRQILSTDKLICFQSWLIKTPFILWLAKTASTIYICHEPPLEYYDQTNINTKNLKQVLIDFIRLPIKWLDFWNISNYKGTIVVNSNFSCKLVSNAYSKQSTVVYPCISDSYYEQHHAKTVRKRRGIISVGAINKLKGFEFLIRSVGTVSESLRPQLTIIGNGSDQHYKLHIQKLAKKLKVNLKIKENISEEELINEYDNSLMFMFAPLSEPFGLVVIEAMSRGLPVIAYSKGGGYAEILTQANGILIDNRNPTSWGLAIQHMLSLKDNELSKIARHNINVSRKYTSQVYATNILKLI